MEGTPTSAATYRQFGVLVDGLWRVKLADRAGVEDRHAVSDRHSLLLVMGDVDQGVSDVPLQAFQFDPHFLAQPGV